VSVVDLSPGSGQLARAALSEEVVYHGFTANVAHQHFVQNVVDTHAVSVITQQGSSLYQSDLAGLIKELYSDLLNKEGDEQEDPGDATMSEGES
jgi:hypothetical protein